MSIASHADVVAAVASFAIRSDVAALVPDWIALTEAELNRRLRVRRMQQRDTASISDEWSAVPLLFNGVIAFEIDGKPLTALSPTDANRMAEGYASVSARPRYYTVVGNQFRYLPAPDQAYTAELTYWKRLSPLVDGSNWLIDRAPDLYVYGALRHLGVRQLDKRTEAWSTAFEKALSELIEADKVESFGPGLTPVAHGMVV